MKKLLLTMLGVLLALPAIAHDFEYEYEGQTITYSVLDEDAKTVAVTSGSGVSGDVVLPANPKDGEVEYTLTSIGNEAFHLCSSLVSVEIPNSVTSIGAWAFSWCRNLTSVEIPTSVTSIGDHAFYWSTSLTSVEIPNSVTVIGSFTFQGCSSLTSIEVDSENPNYSSSDGILFNKDFTELIQYPGGKTGDYTIPNSVTSIGNGAFSSCSGLTSVVIPNSVTYIDAYTFDNCSGLTYVEIPNSVTSIGYMAFCGCTSLTSVVIPNSVTYIEYLVFSGCSSLTSVEIPNSVTVIGSFTFQGCSSLTSIEVDSENPNYSSSDGILFNKDFTELIQYPGGKTGDYTIPNSVTSIGNGAFSDCSSLTSVGIPNSVTSIGSQAFFGCSSLTSVEIPNSVTSIDFIAFSECSSLISVYYNKTEPIVADYSIFSDTTYNNATLYVPESDVETFKQTEPWGNFQNIQGYTFSTGMEDVTAGIDETLPCEYFNLSGVKMDNTRENLAPGIYIMRQGNATRKIVVK